MVRSFDWQFMLHSYLCSIFLLGICFASFFIPIVLHLTRILTCMVPLLLLLILHIPERQSHTLPVEMYSAALVWHFACLLYTVVSFIVYFVSFHCITYIHHAVQEIDGAYAQYMLEARTPVHPTSCKDNLDAIVAESAAYSRMRKRIGRYFRSKTQESVTELLPRIKDTIQEPILDLFPAHVPTHHPPTVINKGITSIKHRNGHPHLNLHFVPTPSLKTPISHENSDKSSSPTVVSNLVPNTKNQTLTVPFIQDNLKSASVTPAAIIDTQIIQNAANLAPISHLTNSNRYPAHCGHTYRSKVTRFSSEDLERSLRDSHPLFNQSYPSLPTLSFFGSSTSRHSSQKRARLISRFIPRTKLGLIFTVSYVPSDIIARFAIPASFSFFLFFYAIVYLFRFPGY